MVVAGLLRGHVGQFLQASKAKRPLIYDRASHTLQHCSKIRSGAAHYIPTYQWYIRKQHYADVLQQQADWCDQQADVDTSSDADDPMSMMMNNPMGMMKGNMAFMVQK